MAQMRRSTAEEIMKTILLILFLILPVSAAAQELKTRSVEPIRVSIQTSTEDDALFRSLVRDELNKFRDLVVTERKPDFSVFIVGTELREGDKRFGFAVALLVVDEARKVNRYHLSIHTAPTLQRSAKYAISVAYRDHLSKGKGN